MALDLNIPPPEAGEDDPFGGFPHVQDHHLLLEHLLLTPAWQQTNQVRKFAGAPSFHTRMHAYTWVMWFTSIFSLFHAQ
jgi:hypothetical protein